MRLKIRHATAYTYDSPVRGVVQALRLTPRDHDGQHVLAWRVDVDTDGSLRRADDEFGNITHTFSTDQAVRDVRIIVEGEVETLNTSGVLRGTIERFPPELFCRDTELTIADAEIRAFARKTTAGAAPLVALHALVEALHNTMTFDAKPTESSTTAAEAFGLKRGVCQDFAHIFIAAARHLGIPARYVGGHLWRPDGSAQNAGHAWAEAFVPDLGWVGFDPANKMCPDDTYVRVAAGLDYLGAAPVRGARSGTATETLDVQVTVIGTQSQSQS